MSRRSFIILLMFELYPSVMGLPSPNSPTLPSHKLTPIPTLHSNGTIAISAPVTILSTHPALTIASPSNAMASSSPNSASQFQNQSRWSPGDVGTVLFGCIGSVLGILTLCLTLWLGRQRFKLIIKKDYQEELQLESLS